MQKNDWSAGRSVLYFLCVFFTSVEYQYSPVGNFSAIPLLVWYIWLGKLAGKWFLISKDMLYCLIWMFLNSSVYVLLKEIHTSVCISSFSGLECMFLTTMIFIHFQLSQLGWGGGSSSRSISFHKSSGTNDKFCEVLAWGNLGDQIRFHILVLKTGVGTKLISYCIMSILSLTLGFVFLFKTLKTLFWANWDLLSAINFGFFFH